MELLRILDALSLQKTQRDIAIELYGQEEVDGEWYDASALRARVRRRIAKALEMRDGGYIKLLDGKG